MLHTPNVSYTAAVSTRMSKGAAVRKDGGILVSMTPLQMAWHVNNSSMNGVDMGDSLNADKNTNVFSPKTIRYVAESFRAGVKITTTPMLVCPDHPGTGTPTTFLEAYISKVQLLEGENQVSADESYPWLVWLAWMIPFVPFV